MNSQYRVSPIGFKNNSKQVARHNSSLLTGDGFNFGITIFSRGPLRVNVIEIIFCLQENDPLSDI